MALLSLQSLYAHVITAEGLKPVQNVQSGFIVRTKTDPSRLTFNAVLLWQKDNRYVMEGPYPQLCAAIARLRVCHHALEGGGMGRSCTLYKQYFERRPVSRLRVCGADVQSGRLRGLAGEIGEGFICGGLVCGGLIGRISVRRCHS